MVKSQSAMEYLMTYGWAILIIAVVLSVLFQLGVFSSGNFQPHAQPGACQVSRTAAGVSLEGQCNGMLPQYTLYLPGTSQTDNVLVPLASSVTLNSFTLSFWFNMKTLPTTNYMNLITGSSQNQFPQEFLDGSDNFWAGFPSRNIEIFSPSTNTWYNIMSVDADGSCVSYLNGVPTGGTWNCQPANGAASFVVFGVQSAQMYNGYLSNVQIYNTSLSSSEVNALYLEGIGGAPIRPQNIVGWWPLNGNANDYSGNGNNGQLNGVTFSSSWENGYTAP